MPRNLISESVNSVQIKVRLGDTETSKKLRLPLEIWGFGVGGIENTPRYNIFCCLSTSNNMINGVRIIYDKKKTDEEHNLTPNTCDI